MRHLLWFVFVFAFIPCGSRAAAPASAYVNFESSQTNPIRLSSNNSRLYAVNTADSRLSVFDVSRPATPSLVAEIPVGMEPVSVAPRTDDEVWVVSQLSDSVSIVSLSRKLVTDTIYTKDEPADVLFTGSYAFVTNARNQQVSVYNATTHALVKTIPLLGGNPRAMALSPDGSKVYVAFAHSGNKTTIIPAALAPPPQPVQNPALPPAPQVGLIVKADDPRWAPFIRYSMPDNDVASIDTTSLTVSGYFTGVGTINLAIAVRPTTGELYVANTDARNTVQFEPVLRGHWVDNRITRILPAGRTTTIYDLNPGIDYSTLPNPGALTTALAQPTALVFDDSGQHLFVAAFGTDRVAILNPGGHIIKIIEIGPASGTQVSPATKRGPRGLALNNQARILYVMNRISNSISLVDTARLTLSSEIPVGTYDPTPDAIRNGRGFLYDAKLSGNGTGACASCHIDGENDHVAWDLGDPNGNMTTVVNPDGTSYSLHPMKGPMVTQVLRGLQGLTPYHWRGDRPDFAAFNVAFNSLMGGTPLSDTDMSAFTSFINTVVYQPNPNQQLNRTLPAMLNGYSPLSGKITFTSVAFSTDSPAVCNSCHIATPGPGTNGELFGRAGQAQPLKVPQLRSTYQKQLFTNTAGAQTVDGFGYSSDGTYPTLVALLNNGRFPNFTNQFGILNDLAAFLSCFDTGTAPAVGFAVTLRADNVSAGLTNVAILEQQAGVGNIDLIAKGTLNGSLHGLVFDSGQKNFKADTASLGPYTMADLVTLIRGGDTLTMMGVPPGSGTRMGIDRNSDGIPDGDQ